MKQSLNRDTLAYQLGMRPGVQMRDMGSFPTDKAVASLLKFEDMSNAYSVVFQNGESSLYEKPKDGNAERDALIFYMLNHAVSIVRSKCHMYQPLGKYLPVVKAYHEQLAMRSTRMFFYLLLICTRESRHDAYMKSESSAWESLVKKYPPSVRKFHRSLNGKNPTTAAQKLRDDPPEAPIGDYTRFLSEVFYKGSFGSGFGGPAWGKVADVLRDYVNGTTSAEMMMDTAFTLCHNGGPIFNKGMLFDSDFQDIYKILDVQHSGQIPQLIAEQGNKHTKDPIVQSLYQLCADALGPEFVGTGYVDWYKVEEMGIPGKCKTYTSQKAAQSAKHGFPSKLKAKMEAEVKKKEIEAAEQMEKLLAQVEIFPGQFIQKLKVRA